MKSVGERQLTGPLFKCGRYPLDMVRGRLTIQAGKGGQYTGIMHATSSIIREVCFRSSPPLGAAWCSALQGDCFASAAALHGCLLCWLPEHGSLRWSRHCHLEAR